MMGGISAIVKMDAEMRASNERLAASLCGLRGACGSVDHSKFRADIGGSSLGQIPNAISACLDCIEALERRVRELEAGRGQAAA